jgi:ADP-heptose:LPS heptosyltransferase
MRAPSINLAGKTTIPELAGVACQADLMISVDTGTLHIGRALGVPMVILASAYQTPTEWLPLGHEKFLILRRDYVPCALCWKSSCATMECMQEISVDDVVEAVEKQFELFPPSLEQRRQRIARNLAGQADAAGLRGRTDPLVVH